MFALTLTNIGDIIAANGDSEATKAVRSIVATTLTLEPGDPAGNTT